MNSLFIANILIALLWWNLWARAKNFYWNSSQFVIAPGSAVPICILVVGIFFNEVAFVAKDSLELFGQHPLSLFAKITTVLALDVVALAIGFALAKLESKKANDRLLWSLTEDQLGEYVRAMFGGQTGKMPKQPVATTPKPEATIPLHIQASCMVKYGEDGLRALHIYAARQLLQ
jgi:hypothetical protein